MYVLFNSNNDLVQWGVEPIEDGFEIPNIDYYDFENDLANGNVRFLIANRTIKDLLGTPEHNRNVAKYLQSFFDDAFTRLSFGYVRNVPKDYPNVMMSFDTAMINATRNNGLPAGVITLYLLPDFTQFTTPEEVSEWLIQNSYKNGNLTLEQFGAWYDELSLVWNNIKEGGQ